MSHLPEKSNNEAAARNAAIPPRRSDPGSSGAVSRIAAGSHQAGRLMFKDSDYSAEDYWNQLPARVIERLAVPPDDEGIAWWAWSDTAAVFRRRALAAATKQVAGGWEVFSIPLDPESHERYEKILVDHSYTTRAASHGSATTNGPTQAPPAPRPANTPPLRGAATQFLGNLPVDAQRFLQLPFADAATEPRYSWHYRMATEIDGTRTLHVWCYLANRKHVTFFTATRFKVSAENPFARSMNPWHSVLTYARPPRPASADVVRT